MLSHAAEMCCSDLGDAQPVVGQLHGFRSILHWFHWVPGLPVGAQAYAGYTEAGQRQRTRQAGSDGPRNVHATWRTAVDQCSQCFAVAPVPAEIVDGQIRNFVLDPAQKTLLRRL